ncbi:MAG: J domain-containing protein [bacterium]
MLSFKKRREKWERRRRREALGGFLRVVRGAESTPELIQRVAESRFYMKCCAALAKKDQNRAGALPGLRRELEQEARLRGYPIKDIKRRLARVAGVLGIDAARKRQVGLQADYYRELDVSAGAGDKEVKEAYHRMARKTHPDAAGGEMERFIPVHEAYEALSDPARRRQYDESRKHEMHLGWSENEQSHAAAGVPPPRRSRLKGYISLLTLIILAMIAAAFIVDAILF